MRSRRLRYIEWTPVGASVARPPRSVGPARKATGAFADILVHLAINSRGIEYLRTRRTSRAPIPTTPRFHPSSHNS